MKYIQSPVDNQENKRVLDKVGVEKSLLASVKARKLKYFGHVQKWRLREEGNHARYNTRKMEKRQTKNILE